MTMKNDAKVEEELTSRFKIDIRYQTNFDPSAQKGSFLTRCMIFQLKQYRRIAFHGTEE